MQHVANEQMIRDAVNDEEEMERMLQPPYAEVSREHPMWPLAQAALREVYDPEIPVNIYELGLIYKVDINAANNDVYVEMSLTSPACPVAGEMPGMVENALKTIDGVGEIKVEIVWDPAWDPSRMAETAKLQLNMF